jgi:3-hydroxyacyl-CoA dehydrogenase
MRLEDIKAITVLGAGIMGHGIAQTFLVSGFPVRLFDLKESISRPPGPISKNLELFHDMGLLAKRSGRPSKGSHTTDLREAVQGSDFIIEAAPKFGTQAGPFPQSGILLPRRCHHRQQHLFLTMTDIGARVKKKERLVITHWFNPPHIVPTVEVVKGEKTSDATVEVTVHLLNKVRKLPVKINLELPGFLVNRIQAAMAREVTDLYEKGVASAADIDKAIKGSIGFRLASMDAATMDLGVGCMAQGLQNVVPQIRSSTEAPKALQHLVSQGHYGIKTGKGFYDYTLDFSKAELDEAVRKRDEEFLKSRFT